MQPKDKRLHEIRYKSQPFKYGFEPTLHSYRLSEPLKIKRPSRIFVCSMADLFGRWIPNDWIDRVLNTTKKCPQHTFLFLTKNPVRYSDFELGDNCWIGATTIDRQTAKIFTNTMAGQRAGTKFISAEPLLADISKSINYSNIDWIILGAMTGASARDHRPDVKWIKGILRQADRRDIPVFMKSNIGVVWRGGLRRDFPRHEGQVINVQNHQKLEKDGKKKGKHA